MDMQFRDSVYTSDEKGAFTEAHRTTYQYRTDSTKYLSGSVIVFHHKHFPVFNKRWYCMSSILFSIYPKGLTPDH